MRKPNFFLIGAPKCGTSSLANWLAQHPNVFFSTPKEPHYFSTDTLCSVTRLAQYERYFDGVGPEHVAIGEGSTHYLHSEVAVPSILEYNPDARFIVCLRDPVDMAPSVHSERIFSGIEDVTSFAEAWSLQDERDLGNYIPVNARRQPFFVQYRSFCRQGEMVERLLTHVPLDRVLVLLLDDLRDSPASTYARTLEFLAVDPGFEAEFVIRNERKAVKSPRLAAMIRYGATIKRRLGSDRRLGVGAFLRDLNGSRGTREEIDMALEQEMREYYRNDVDLLEKLIGRNLSAWRTSQRRGS